MTETASTRRILSYVFAAAGILLLAQHHRTDAFAFQRPPRTVATSAIHRNSAIPITLISHRSQTAVFSPQTVLHGWFGGGGTADSKKDAVLGTFDIKTSSKDNTKVDFESLSDYLRNKWAPLFVNGNIKLTTPVKLDQVALLVSSEDDGVDVASGVRLLFQKVDTGYKSKDEEEEEDTKTESKKEKKDNEPRQGGVEVLVEMMENGALRVVAKRCNVDDDTMIKEMSEESILRELQTAMDVWKKDSALE